MHVLLQTFDIVDSICSLIQQDHNVGQKSLQALSLTCVTLSEVALDRLWHTQPNFVALIKTMPRKYWFERGSPYNLDFEVRGLTVDVFARLNFYARRIRKVLYVPHGMHRSHNVPSDIKALHTLWSLLPDPTHPILPNLKHVQFPDARHIMLDMFLATPSLTVDIGMTAVEPSTAHSLETFGPNIHGLQVGSPVDIFGPGGHAQAAPTQFSEAVLNMTNLRVLTTRFKLDTKVLGYLAKLPFLHKLGASNCSQDILHAIAGTSSGGPFTSLQELELIETDLHSFVNLLKNIGIVRLQHLRIHCVTPINGNDLNTALAALQSARSTEQLRSIRLRAPESHIVFSSTTLRTLLSAPHLSTLQFDVDCRYDLADSDFKDMAAAWPNMQSLQIGPMKGWSGPTPDPQTTLYSLLYLLEGCRHLEQLIFCVNGLIPPPPLSEVTPQHINHQMILLWVGNSPIEKYCVKGIRQFFKTVLPKLAGINGDWSVVSNVRGKMSSKQKLWMSVPKSEEEIHLMHLAKESY